MEDRSLPPRLRAVQLGHSLAHHLLCAHVLTREKSPEPRGCSVFGSSPRGCLRGEHEARP